jgi:hypothetical protein
VKYDAEKLRLYLYKKLEQVDRLEVLEYLEDCEICSEFISTTNLEIRINKDAKNNEPDMNRLDPVRLIRKSDGHWSIILAGGDGERISADTHRWKGRAIPKQYCAFAGKRSMLQHTLARADI